LLEPLGATIAHVGPVGAGHALKALNNLLSATTLLASAEALLVGRRFGLDPHVMLEVINGGSGRSYSTEAKLEQFVLSERFDAGFALRLMAKDVRTALALAHATGVETPLSETSAQLWNRAEEELPAGVDHTEIARWLEQRQAGG